MEEYRLAAVFASDGSGREKTSTGYAIASRLLLTAAHAIEPADRIAAQFIGQSDPMRCRVLWDGRERGFDVALLEVDATVWPTNIPGNIVRFGLLATLIPGASAETLGFPAAQCDQTGNLETAHVSGHINPGDRLLSGRWVLSVEGSSPEDLGRSPWTGMSGAPLFCGDLLCGVVVVDPPHWRHGKLDAEQIHRLLQQEDFRVLLRNRLGYCPVAEAVELQPLAESQALSRRPLSLTELLRPQAEAVRFLGRDKQLKEFHAWCKDGGVSARLLTGTGGQGKTRFALELGRLLASEGWVIARLRDNVPSGSYRTLAKIRPNLLLIMDYADTRPSTVTEVMRVLEEENKESTVRILLIARSAGEWWDQLPSSASTHVGMFSGAKVINLNALADDLSARQQLYRAALVDLAHGLQGLPDYAEVDWNDVAGALPAADLSDSRLSSALTLQIRVLTDLLAAHPTARLNQRSTIVEAEFIEHEERYWTKTASQRPPLRALGSEALRNAVAAATLTRVSEKQRAVDLLAHVPPLNNTPEHIRYAVASWLHDLYPESDGSYWGALEPDRLGEFHVGARLGKERRLLHEFLPALNVVEAERALTVLARAGAQAVCPYPELLDMVSSVIAANPERLAVPATSVATQTENPEFLIRALADLAARADLSLDVLEELNSSLPDQTARLALPALEIANRLVRARRIAARNIWIPSMLSRWASAAAESSFSSSVALDRPLSARASSHAELARAYHNLSHRFILLERWDEAIVAGEQAIRLYRRLSSWHPQVFRPLFAGSLDNQAIALSSANRLEEALKASQKAQKIYRILAEDNSDLHLVNLARSLSNVSGILAQLGAYQAGLKASTEAVSILSELAERNPGRYLPELTSALHNQASRYAKLDWISEAVTVSAKVVEIRRQLSLQRPDAALPSLANSLHNFAIDLMEVKRETEAVDAINESILIYLELAKGQPDTYIPRLAKTLNVKSALCCGSISDREAVISSARSVLLYVQLVQTRPGEFEEDLRSALLVNKWILEGAKISGSGWAAVLEKAEQLIQRGPHRKSPSSRDRALRIEDDRREYGRDLMNGMDKMAKLVTKDMNNVKMLIDHFYATTPQELYAMSNEDFMALSNEDFMALIRRRGAAGTGQGGG